MNYGFTDLLTLLGSLGLFLYGMKVMSDALIELAGDRMRSILAAATSNRFFALLTGFFVTAAIQSSSAASLMVVSFVNAGLFTLSEAVGVIMGANIGTTVTAWLITILGFKVNMGSAAIPLVGVGFLFTLSKDYRKKNTGLFLVGFALLFVSLEFLKESMPDIRNHPELLAFLSHYISQGYLSLLLFVAIGALMTLIVQSSSAAMALTLLMTHEGWIPFDMAAAMVLGQNVGTTITANLAALVANYQAKRAALAHLIFNLLGVLWVLLLFSPFIKTISDVVLYFEGLSPLQTMSAVPIALSLFHTCVNVLNALLLIGFIGLIVRGVERLIPAVAEKTIEIDQPRYLSEDALKFTPTAIKALFDESLRLLQNTAYKVIANGLGVHRKDLESGRGLTEIVEESDYIPIDIDQVYSTRIKSIYGSILEYATQLQSRANLTEQEVETIRNILIADRMLVQVVKTIKPLQHNIERYLKSDNLAIRREYNLLRHRVLKVIRYIHGLDNKAPAEECFEKLRKQRTKAQQLDVLVTGRVDKLVLSGDIDGEMATSLMNDSVEAARVAQMLVDIAQLLYVPSDSQVSEIVDDSIAMIQVAADALPPQPSGPAEGL